MSINSIDRMYKIIHLLSKKPLSLKEIKATLKLDINDMTIRRDFKNIENDFGYLIEYNRKEKVYTIEKINNDFFNEKMLDSIAIMSAIKQTENTRQCIYLEKRQSSGVEFFSDIIDAIDNKNVLAFTLNSYWNPPTKRKCAPIAIKEAMKRWYLIGYDLDKKEIRNYGLDRLSNFRILDQKISPPKVDVNELYKNAFGIENYTMPTEFILKFEISQLKYLKSLPLHHSQEIYDVTDDYFYLKMFVHPAYELKMEILKFSDYCEVIEPKSYRKELKATINKLYNKYKV
ncbi:WYL domain-containing transcriptional regulator [Empedobacter falsenii]